MTRYDLAATSINGIIGAGIFGLPSAAAGMLGVASPIGFVICAVIVYVLVLCFAEVASRFTGTGGPYLYARESLGPFVGFVVGWALWLARVGAFAANSNLLVSYAGFFIPQVAAGLGRTAVLIIVPGILMLINIRGVTPSARFGAIVATFKIGALLLFAIVGLAFVNWSSFFEPSVQTKTNWPGAFLLLIYVFTGFESSVIPAAEAKDPLRDLPWALTRALAISAVIYVLIQTVAVGTVPDLSSSQRPLADSAQTFMGPAGGTFIALLACISIIGNLTANALGSSRLTYAFAERKDFPALFGRVHPVYRTPIVSIVFFSVISAVLAISGTFVWLVTVSVIARLVTYMATCLAVPLLRKQSRETAHFHIPFGAFLPISGVLLCLWLIIHAETRDVRDFAVASVVGALLYLARPRHSAV